MKKSLEQIVSDFLSSYYDAWSNRFIGQQARRLIGILKRSGHIKKENK